VSRVLKRVPLDFNWPKDKVWEGYLLPKSLRENKCPDCKNGYSDYAEELHDLWYGYRPFNPESTGSTWLRHDTPAVRAFAERNVTSAPDYYGRGDDAIVREGMRLANLWNGMWSHHLTQDDVDTLVASNRLWDFTRRVVPGVGWVDREPPVRPTAAEVNEWSLRSMGHDGSNAYIVIRERCKREGVSDTCSTCDGHSTLEAYEGQRAEAEAWEPEQPPVGEGWQMWETVSEGSPVSPVFATADELVAWMTAKAGCSQGHSEAAARAFVKGGSSMCSFVSTGDGRIIDGIEALAELKPS
jgi:hypothetical protein